MDEKALSTSRWPILAAVLLLMASTLWIVKGAEAKQRLQEPNPPQVENCLECHVDPDLSVTLPSGEELSLYIQPEELNPSVHSELGIYCDSCHPDIVEYPHPDLPYQDKRELSRALYQSCQLCHADNYEETLDSIHAEMARAGNPQAPICTDCHGTHDIRPPDQPRTLVSTTCSQCHEQIYHSYRESIHGAALIEADNPDVPVCTDCHGVHNIQDPRTALFRAETPEMCAHCHSDPELMGKYNLPADVYNIYQVSWHGVDVSVYKANWPGIWHESAVCTDCHGVHEILPASDPQSMVHPDNLLATCQECHTEAGPNWVGAWTGHHEVSLQRTPFVFYTELFYDIYTPFVLVMTVVWVLLHMIRALAQRARRSL